jgi:hypothetical protein
VAGDEGTTKSPLYIVSVLPAKVILHASGKSYQLGYPDQLGKRPEEKAARAESPADAMAEIDPGGELKMFQNLLNSPLGALGKSVIGDKALQGLGSDPPAAKRSRRTRQTPTASSIRAGG